jgi:hypothetical protein
MRTAWLSAVLVLVACGSSTTSSGVDLTFGPAGATSAAGVFTTTPGAAAMIQGELSATGDFAGEYTLTTSVPSGSPLATCLVAVDGGTAATSVEVDAASGQTHTVTVEITVGPAYQGQAVCDVTATNEAKAGVGDTVIISVTQATGDAG